MSWHDVHNPIRLYFLGIPKAEHKGIIVRGFESRKALALLAYLTMQGGIVPRQTLAALFWPDKTEARANGNLRRLLHNILSQLPELLNIDRQAVRLNACWIDCIAFEQLQSLAQPDALSHAVELYRGSFLDGFLFDDSPELESWLLQQRELWHTRMTHALAQLIQTAYAQQNWSAGLIWVDRLLQFDQWREEAHQDKMRLLALSGQRDSAMAQYEICRRVLANELGLTPSRETSFLYEQIRDGLLQVPQSPAPQYSNLPLPTTELLGRHKELQQIDELLARPNYRLLTILGTGGVGKTHLALTVAHRQQTRFRDGVWLVDLTAIREPAALIPTIMQRLDLPPVSNITPQKRLCDWLRDKQILLLLDNFEQIRAAALDLQQVLAACPGVVILVTSRIPLRLRGEQLFVLGPLDLPDLAALQTPSAQQIDSLHTVPAIALFIERARMVQPNLETHASNLLAIAQICVRLDGLPLALELAAARTKLFPPVALLARLERRLSLLAQHAQDRPEHQQTIRHTIDWSYQLLEPSLQVLFTQLSVFVDGWTLELAEAVVLPETSDPHAVWEGLETLLDHNLIYQRNEEAEPRFFMLETIREYAVEQLERSPFATELRQRHAEAFSAIIKRYLQTNQGPNQELLHRRLVYEQQNVMSAIAWLQGQHQIETALLIAATQMRPWRTQGLQNEGVAILTQLLGEAERVDLDQEILARGFYAAGSLANAQGELAKAEQWLQRSIAIYQHINHQPGTVQALCILGGVAFDQGQLQAAKAYWQQMLQLADHAELLRDQVLALGNLGEVAYHLQELEQAYHYTTQGLQLALAYGFSDLEAQQEANLGILLRHSGELDQAMTKQHRALELWQQLEDRWHCTILIEQIASTLAAQGRWRNAARLLGAAAQLRRQIGIPPSLPDRQENERNIQSIRKALGEKDWLLAYEAGQALSFDTLINEALSLTREQSPQVIHYLNSQS